MNSPVAAVLLAGGHSRRMGSDKALLRLPDGQRLWERQLDVLRALEPAELFISGPARDGFPKDVPLLVDEVPGCGPLGGIAAALRTVSSPRVVVLAIDLPQMTSGFLRNLSGVADTSAGKGIVSQTTDGFFEPLAAIYPQAAWLEANQRLRSGELSLQLFVRSLVKQSLMTIHPLAEADSGLFANWNRPEDLAS